MAEALAPVPDAVLTCFRAGPWTTPASAAGALARELLPEEASVTPPSWLLPTQVRSLRRVVAALRRHRGALLADPLGSGKTYVALAAALTLHPRRPVICLVPAALIPQWRTTAQDLRIDVAPLSHEQVSRGRLPHLEHGVVVIDEAHRFRNPRSRRYRHLAPWLVGRTTLLLTATPVVNRLSDLLHQLLLVVRDDALLPDGVPSLRALLSGGTGSPALGRLVFERGTVEARPTRTDQVSHPGPEECLAAESALDLLESFALSRSGPIASLVRSVLRHAAASSPPALIGALRRYRGLLLHARDALAAGRPMDRAELRRFTGEAGDQLVLWEVIPLASSPGELDLEDLARLDTALATADRWAARSDPKLDRLRKILADGKPTLVFVARRETVRHLRDGLGRGVAWCTGRRAGLDSFTLSRATVFEWFREGLGAAAGMRAGARHLVVTDVAAEGLDLQRAARVVHYDLPWTPMRLDQRDGRALRLGSRHPIVDVVRFALPPVLERALRLEAALHRKRGLTAIAGLGPAGRRLWRWRSELAESLQTNGGEIGVAGVPCGPAGALVGVGLYAASPVGEVRLAFVLGWLDGEGRWTEDPDTVASRLTAAVACKAAGRSDTERLRGTLAQLAQPVRARLAAVRERRWATTSCDGAARVVASRLQIAVREAARRRDASRLETLERALGFVAGGHTAGETMLLERLAIADDATFGRALARLPPPSPSWGTVEARLSSVLLFAGE